MDHNNAYRRQVLLAGGGLALASWASPMLSATSVVQTCQEAPTGPTGQDVEGPFFRDGTPRRTVLCRGDEAEILTVLGTVSGNRGKSGIDPVTNARIEIWHASPAGQYDNDSDAFHYRGHFFTNSDGGYEFLTATPAGYRDGPLDRPAHIHFRISAEGFNALTTQLYFRGDAKLAGDVFVKQNDGNARAKPLERLEPGRFRTRFDIRLAPVI